MDDQEGASRDAVRRRDVRGAAATMLDLYGSELFGYALWLARSERYAEIGYEDAVARIRRELRSFTWEFSARVWGHAVVRETLRTVQAEKPVLTIVFDPRTLEPRRPHGKFVFPVHADQAELLRLLQQRFSEDDQELLLLRWGRRLSSREIALILEGPGATESRIDQEAKRLRVHLRALEERAAIFKEELRRLPS